MYETQHGNIIILILNRKNVVSFLKRVIKLHNILLLLYYGNCVLYYTRTNIKSDKTIWLVLLFYCVGTELTSYK